jgi:acyl carrier protein
MPETNPNTERLAGLPQPILIAYQRFQKEGDPKAFCTVLHHLMADFEPDLAERSPDILTDSVHLVDDLGLNSLAITEMVFYFEDLFGVAITNAELRGLLTVGDLRRFVSDKIRAA